MKLIPNAEALESEFLRCIKQCQTVSFAVAWASNDFTASKELFKHRKKIKKGVVGLHFHRTDPDFIENYFGHDNVRFVTSRKGVFHPKVYLFEYAKGKWECIVGSANFTNGAFSSNDEFCVLIDSDSADSGVGEGIRKNLTAYFERARPFDEDALSLYRVLWQRGRRRAAAQKSIEDAAAKGRSPLETDLLKFSWNRYSEEVHKDQHHAIALRAAVLSEARRRFERAGSFSLLTDDERKNLAGFQSDGELEWGWFGSMRGAGLFKNAVNRNDPHLSTALEFIPLKGEVTRDHYLDYVAEFERAFRRGRGHGLATATRLLAMKRPDYFLCLDRPNAQGVKDAFGISFGTHSYELYWDGFVERVLMSNWWNAVRPKNQDEAQIWDGRTAFLDSIFYDTI